MDISGIDYLGLARVLERGTGEILAETDRLMLVRDSVSGANIHVRVEDGEAWIAANAEGLRSLANHLLALAEEQSGTHLHLDRYNSLEENSAPLLLERI